MSGMWNVKITGPDADGLMWLALSHPEKGSVAFSAPIDSVRGEIMKRACEDFLNSDRIHKPSALSPSPE
jgi:hypothetical protein